LYGNRKLSLLYFCVQVSECIVCLEIKSDDDIITILDTPPKQVKRDTTGGGERYMDSLRMEVDDTDPPTPSSTSTPEHWKCRKCTLLNIPQRSRCDICGCPKQDNVRTTLPKLIVTPTRKSPVKSDGLKKDTLEPIHPSASTGVWVCLICSYGNNPSCTSSCDMCSSLRQTYETDQTDHFTPKPHTNPTNANENGLWAKMMKLPPFKVAKLRDAIPPESSTKNNEPRGRTDVLPSIGGASNNVSQMTWSCPKCTVVNFNSVRDCKSCGTLRTATRSEASQQAGAAALSRNGIEVKDGTVWTCSKCTFRNISTAHVCGVCQAKRIVSLPTLSTLSEPSVAHPSGSWTCSLCTFFNPSSSTVCEMCNCSKSRSKTPHQSGVVAVVKAPPVSASAQFKASDRSSFPPGGLRRQNSVLVEDVRRIEEKLAKDQWTQIVNFCQVVIIIICYCFVD